tara:strand:- start:1603 stop:2163 length:561 start_codon:yes stop_codon:yes gene_type:complete
MEKLAARALVTGKPYAQSEMSELRERRGAWGLRLVAAQIKGVDNVKREVARLENGLPSSSSSVNGTASQTSDAVSEREVKRLEVLAQEKQALLTRLTEKEKEGAVASEGAKALRGEVVQLRTQLNDAQQKLQRNSKLNADATYGTCRGFPKLRHVIADSPPLITQYARSERLTLFVLLQSQRLSKR